MSEEQTTPATEEALSPLSMANGLIDEEPMTEGETLHGLGWIDETEDDLTAETESPTDQEPTDTENTSTKEEDAATPEGDGESKGQDGAPPDDNQPKPVSLTLDGVEYAEDQLTEAVKTHTTYAKVDQDLIQSGLGGVKDAIEKGIAYSELQKQFTTPEGALEVINELVDMAFQQFAGFEAPASVDALQNLDPANMTATEKALLNLNRQQKANIDKLIAANEQFRQETLKELEELKRVPVDLVQSVKSEIPNADVTDAQLRQMMKEQGVDDPVKAYKLATYGKPSKAETKSTNRPAAIPGDAGKSKTYDSRNANADQIYWYEKNGYVDINEKVGKR